MVVLDQNILHDTMVDMTWEQIKEAADRNSLVLLPVGIIEEHSRHLPVGTDIYIATAQAIQIAQVMNEQEFPCLVAPPMYWGISSALTKQFPGTFSMREETVISLIYDILSGLELAGFHHVVAVNAHGDPKHREAIVTAFQTYNSLHKLQARWLTFQDDIEKEGLKGTEDYILAVPPYPFEKLMHLKKNSVDSFDVHAGAYETALMRDLFPDLVDVEVAKKLPATMLKQEGIEKWISGKREDMEILPDGHVRDPAFSSYIFTNLKASDIAIAHSIMVFYKEQI